MTRLLPIMLFAVCAWCQSAEAQTAPQAASPAAQSAPQSPASNSPQSTSASGIPIDQVNAQKAKAVLQQAIQALGGPAWLNLKTRELQGRTYAMHHGQSSGNGVLFWSFTQFPDKERVEFTKERDVTQVFLGDKGYEITYKGVHPIEEKLLVDHARLRKFSLDIVLRTWVNDPTVALFYDGFAVAAEHDTEHVVLINAQNEGVDLYLDSRTHLPVKKSFTWRDPADRQRNIEDEIYGNYRPVQGLMTPWDTTRYFNGDMSAARFLNSAAYDGNLNPAMFDPNSGYNPNKPSGKH